MSTDDARPKPRAFDHAEWLGLLLDQKVRCGAKSGSKAGRNLPGWLRTTFVYSSATKAAGKISLTARQSVWKPLFLNRLIPLPSPYCRLTRHSHVDSANPTGSTSFRISLPLRFGRHEMLCGYATSSPQRPRRNRALRARRRSRRVRTRFAAAGRHHTEALCDARSAAAPGD